MGNQLVGIAPSQIFPVEHYLRDHTNLKFDVSLGSTRFLKVARADSQEGLIVTKVFAIHDPTLPLTPYKDRLEEIRQKLSNAVNCLPFQKIVVTEKAGLIMREYVKYSLYDCISTRPFLTNIEKRWITFQVLYALHQCHKVGVCHGDIKLENITITSWNWVLLVDFASFKPAFLPEDNPADYSYFFDTSRRRTCYIAPERFIKTMNTDSNQLFYENSCNYSDLTPAMDIFSAGCALIELWNEGHAPFDLSQLLAYRNGEYSPAKHVSNIEDAALRELLANMILREPTERKSAEIYLSDLRGNFFPEYFYSFLQSYMLIFSASPILSCDEKILRLKKDIGSIFQLLSPGNSNSNIRDNSKVSDKSNFSDNSNVGGNVSGNNNSIGNEDDGLVIIVSLVTSCVRGLHDAHSKLSSLEILVELAQHVSEETILDRILPYILYFAHGHTARVRCAAIDSITTCLSLIHRIPRSDSNIFPEYILPGLSSLAMDPSTSVRATYARNIASLAEIALRFLDQSVSSRENVGEGDDNTGSGTGTGTGTVTGTGKVGHVSRVHYTVELQTLHEMVQQTVSALLTDGDSRVKETLMDSGFGKLCVFFGKQKANDLLLSHMITFLNDKEDKQLRGTFFDCIIGVAAYIGWHSSTILTPLLLQGLTDCCEFVATKAIHAMASLTELGLLDKPSLCELVRETCGFLVHPNLWIRQAVVGFIATTTTRAMSLLDVQCKVMPYLRHYMKYDLIQVDKPELLLESLMPPIPRNVFDSVVKYPDLPQFIESLECRKRSRDMISLGKVPSLVDYTMMDMPNNLKNLFRRLEANGMDEVVEIHLLRISAQLLKIHKQKCCLETATAAATTTTAVVSNKVADGRIEINSLKSTVRSHVHHLLSDSRTKPDFLLPQNKQSESTSSGGAAPSSLRPSSPGSNTLSDHQAAPFHHHDNAPNMSSLHERSYIQYRTPNCSVELRTLITRQQDHYLEAMRSREWAEHAAWQPQLPPPGWRVRGVLVGHLHEHRGPVTSLVPLGSSSGDSSSGVTTTGNSGNGYFASGGGDGYVRLWDCARMVEGKNIANRSRAFYRLPGKGAQVVGMTSCSHGTALAAVTNTGLIQVLPVDNSTSRLSPRDSRTIPASDGSAAVDVQYLDSGPQSVLVYATLYGALVGWDLRSPEEAWRLENGLKQGVITTFCLDSHQSWLTLGTSSGVHIAWDLRFRLPIATIEHPSALRIRKVVSHPTEHSLILSSVQSNNNEISMWNLETGFRQKVLWGSKSPPLSKSNSSSHSVCAMRAGCIDRAGFLLAGGTDQKIRFWDLERPRDSYVAVAAPLNYDKQQPPPSSSSQSTVTTSYDSRLIDGAQVIYEVAAGGDPLRATPAVNPAANSSSVAAVTATNVVKSSDVEQPPRAGPEPPSSGHRDAITDVALCKASQCFLVSASRDGVIKVWK